MGKEVAASKAPPSGDAKGFSIQPDSQSIQHSGTRNEASRQKRILGFQRHRFWIFVVVLTVLLIAGIGGGVGGTLGDQALIRKYNAAVSHNAALSRTYVSCEHQCIEEHTRHLYDPRRSSKSMDTNDTYCS